MVHKIGLFITFDVMKRFFPLFLIACLLVIACEDEATTDEQTIAVAPTTETTSTPQETDLSPIPPAVEDDETVDRTLGQSELKNAEINQAGIQLNLKLPPGSRIQTMANGNEKALLINAEDGSFQIVVTPAEIALEDLIINWQENTPVGSFRKFIVNGRGGVLVEVEKEGKAEYHVDYIFEKYRLHTPFDKSFSRMQATKVFNVCRQIQGLNK